jgi:hypothetical protein
MRNRAALAATAIAVLGGLLAPAAEAGRPDRSLEPPYETFVDASCPDSIAPKGVQWSDAGGNFTAVFFDDCGELRARRQNQERGSGPRIVRGRLGESVAPRVERLSPRLLGGFSPRAGMGRFVSGGGAVAALVSYAGAGGLASAVASSDRCGEVALGLLQPTDHDRLFVPGAPAGTGWLSSLPGSGRVERRRARAAAAWGRRESARASRLPSCPRYAG